MLGGHEARGIPIIDTSRDAEGEAGARVDAVIYSDNIVAKNPPPTTRKELN